MKHTMESGREHLKHVLEESLNEIYMFDSKTLRFTYVNKGALLNLGYSMEEMKTMTPLDIKPEYDFQSFDKLTRPLREKVKGKIVFETVHLRKNDSLYPVEVHLQLVQDDIKPVFMAIILDITKRKAFEDEILQLNKNLEKKVEERTASLLSYQTQLRLLASRLSRAEEIQRQQLASELHDNLGQMLTVGKMQVDLLGKYHSSDQTSKYVHKLKEVIDNSIVYTRKLMSDLKPPPSIGDDMKASIGWVAEKAEKLGLNVTIEDDGQSKPLKNEIREAVIQCVRELLFNIVKHTSAKEAVISLKSKDDQLHVTVIDEGKGFDTKNMILAPDTTGGFGLFNIQERIDLLGGRVTIDSEVGKGTKITLCVPLMKEAKEAVPAEKVKEIEPVNKTEEIRTKLEEIRTKQEKKIKVLIVDDHKMVREGFRKIIREQDDFAVVGEAANGEEAIALARETSPDVILMDVSMAGMDGIEATRKIKVEMPNCKIIGLSLHNEHRIIEEMRRAGASAYLTKTEAFESLILTIRAEACV